MIRLGKGDDCLCIGLRLAIRLCPIRIQSVIDKQNPYPNLNSGLEPSNRICIVHAPLEPEGRVSAVHA